MFYHRLYCLKAPSYGFTGQVFNSGQSALKDCLASVSLKHGVAHICFILLHTVYIHLQCFFFFFDGYAVQDRELAKVISCYQ